MEQAQQGAGLSNTDKEVFLMTTRALPVQEMVMIWSDGGRGEARFLTSNPKTGKRFTIYAHQRHYLISGPGQYELGVKRNGPSQLPDTD